jgi:hypothetical protein
LQLRLDHEQIFRAQDAERRDHRSQVLLLEGWIRELDQAISRIRESRTWKLGSALRRFAERFRLRPSQPLAFEHRDDVMRRFADWEARRTP